MLKTEVSNRLDTSVFSISTKSAKSSSHDNFLRVLKPFPEHSPLFLSEIQKDEKTRSVQSIGHFAFFLDLSFFLGVGLG